jgi:amino acid adenylation domain-containing protein
MTSPLEKSIEGKETEHESVTGMKRNGTSDAPLSDYPREKSIAQVFEEVAAVDQERIALEWGSEKLTYRELNARANRVAHQLRKSGAGPEKMVGCFLERSVASIVAFLGIVKSGAAYVPLERSYPKDRLDVMWSEIAAPVVVTTRYLASTIGRPDVPEIVPQLFVDEVSLKSEDAPDHNPSSSATATSLAYVMYTSGSTGRPKGVMVENRAVVRLVRNTNFCNFGPQETFLQFAPLSFDASTLEIWGALLNGGRLVIMPAGAASLEDLGRIIHDYRVTTLWLTAGLFHLMVEQRLEDLRPIRQLIAGGDVLSAPHVRKVLEAFPGIRVINGYGPTENTTFTCCHVMKSGDSVPESVPIGRPISNTRVYILDESLKPVSEGAVGELFAAGDGVARGYLNDAARTAEKFLPDPFSFNKNDRMYRTGDLARTRPDGVIEFLGRLDNQVKILGYRIEPGEIEVALRAHKSIRQVCVVPHADSNGSKRLVAYFTVSGTTGVSGPDLKHFLALKIPSYMIPAIFMQVDALPLSPNGKVDRDALPAPTFAGEDANAAAANANNVERDILAVWKRILRLEQVGLDDNFFDVGGDSLLLIAVQANLQKALGREIPITDLFEFTTVRALAAHVSKNETGAPSFTEAEQQAEKQRNAFARQRERRSGGVS